MISVLYLTFFSAVAGSDDSESCLLQTQMSEGLSLTGTKTIRYYPSNHKYAGCPQNVSPAQIENFGDIVGNVGFTCDGLERLSHDNYDGSAEKSLIINSHGLAKSYINAAIASYCCLSDPDSCYECKAEKTNGPSQNTFKTSLADILGELDTLSQAMTGSNLEMTACSAGIKIQDASDLFDEMTDQNGAVLIDNQQSDTCASSRQLFLALAAHDLHAVGQTLLSKCPKSTSVWAVVSSDDLPAYGHCGISSPGAVLTNQQKREVASWKNICYRDTTSNDINCNCLCTASSGNQCQHPYGDTNGHLGCIGVDVPDPILLQSEACVGFWCDTVAGRF